MTATTRTREHSIDPGAFLEDEHGRAVLTCACWWKSDPIEVTRDEHGLLTDASWDALGDAGDEHIGPLVEVADDQVLMHFTDEWGSTRWHLAGEGIHCGEALELLLPAGWQRVTFEIEHQPDRYGRGPTTPVGYMALGGPAYDNNVPDRTPRTRLDLPPGAVLRWPEGRR